MNTQKSRRSFMKNLLVSTATVTLFPTQFLKCVSTEKKPINFLFILVDDLGWADVGCYGSEFYETPNIDRLASLGMKFTDGYAACPVCSPTRASIVTGKYPARLNLTNFLVGRRPGKLKNAEFIDHLPLEEVTLAEALKERGYTTFFAGKWHLGGREYHPDFQGFDVTRYNGPGAPYFAYDNWNLLKNNPYEVGGYFSPYGSPHLSDGPRGEYLTDRLMDETLKFIEENINKPFLAYLSFHSVHNPLQAKKEYIDYFEDKLKRIPLPQRPEFIQEGENKCRQIQNNAVYAAMIRSIDENVGKAMKKLDQLGIAENTVVFFFSDNGGLSTSEGHNTSNLPLRGGKGWLYEGGIREPLIIRWPGVTEQGSVCNVPVISTDFYPTMLEMASAPLQLNQHADGVSIVPLLKGEKSLGREAIYWHYPHYSNQGGKPGSAIRYGDYKLIEYFEDDSVELFNLRSDMGEHLNLATEKPELVLSLRQKLGSWRREVDAQMMQQK